MMTFKRSAVFQWLIAALALVPVVLYAYLGQFSRLMADDYCTVAFGLEKGAWDYMVWKLNIWSGSYASWFFKGAIAPLDTLAPRITPAMIIVQYQCVSFDAVVLLVFVEYPDRSVAGSAHDVYGAGALDG